MGVKDLWKILKPTARPISPEALKGMILGVDVSIWLNQAIKGMRDRHGNEIPNAHLLVLFNRICKLLHYQIKPIFVFDGPPPPLKLQTLAERRKRKQKASSEISNLLGKRALKMLEVHALQTVTGQEINVTAPKSIRADKEDDIFELPEQTTTFIEDKEESPVPVETDEPSFSNPLYELLRNDSESIDINSETFLALPPEIQHDLLLEKKETQKHSYTNPEVLPKKADDFSDYQLARLKNRNSVTRKLVSVRKALNASQSASYGIPEGKECDIEAKRIVSSEGRHYILIKGKGIASINEESLRDDFLTMDFREPSGQSIQQSEDSEGTPELSQEESHVSVASDPCIPSNYEITRLILSSSSPSTVDSNETAKLTIKEDILLVEDIDPMIDKNPMITDVMEGTSNIDETYKNVACDNLSSISTATLHTQSIDSVEVSSEPPPVVITSKQNYCNIVKSQTAPIQLERSNTNLTQSDNITQTPNTKKPTFDSNLSLSGHISETLISSDTDSFSDVECTELTVKSTGVMSLTPTVVDKDYATSVLQEAKDFVNLPREEIEQALVEQVMELDRRTVQQARQSAGVTNVMYKDAQELLKLFGLPYIESPSEAEAQCAALERLSLTHGTITDDNDVFLFGGRKVYRNVFAPNEDIEMYLLTDVSSLLGLNRDKLIVLAYFLGSDYTDGLEGIGCVNAMELLDSYSGERLEPLVKIKQRNMDSKIKPGLQINETNLQKKVRLLNLPHDFPNESVREAYISPCVDESSETFDWGKPDLDLLRQYTLTKFGWRQKQCDDILLPVIKRINQNQTLITSYTVPKPLVNPSQQRGLYGKSKRLCNAIVRLTGQSSSNKIIEQSNNTKGGNGTGRGRRKRTRRSNNDQSAESTAKFTQQSDDSPPTKRRPNPIPSSSSSSSSSSDE